MRMDVLATYSDRHLIEPLKRHQQHKSISLEVASAASLLLYSEVS
jgi:hypothetical protein